MVQSLGTYGDGAYGKTLIVKTNNLENCTKQKNERG